MVCRTPLNKNKERERKKHSDKYKHSSNFPIRFNAINIPIHLIMQYFCIFSSFSLCLTAALPSHLQKINAVPVSPFFTHVRDEMCMFQIDWEWTEKKIQFRDLQICMQLQVEIMASQMKSKLCQKPIFFLSTTNLYANVVFHPSTRLNCARSTKMIPSCCGIEWKKWAQKREREKNHRSDFLIKKLYKTRWLCARAPLERRTRKKCCNFIFLLLYEYFFLTKCNRALALCCTFSCFAHFKHRWLGLWWRRQYIFTWHQFLLVKFTST